MDKMHYKERFHDAFHEALDKGIVKTGTDLGCTYTYAMLNALKDMAENNVWPDGRFGDDDCNVWSLFHLYESESDDRDDELRTLRGINQSLSKANNALETRNKVLKGELSTAEECIALLKQKNRMMANMLGAILCVIPLNGVELSDTGDIVDSETGEILSE